MGDKTAIAWTEATWNPIRGCSRVSAGCENCYAERQAHRFSGTGGPYDGLTTLRNGRPGWTGEVRFVPEMLDQPLRWRKPRMVFVNSMSDLFHEKLTDEQIAAVLGVIAASPHHTFQVLTKRAQRAMALLRDEEFRRLVEETFAFNAINLANGPRAAETLGGEWEPPQHGEFGRVELAGYFDGIEIAWPLPNVWFGVSVENQAAADERVPLLLETPAAVRWVSAEPLLGPLDLSRWVFDRQGAIRDAMRGPAALNREQAEASIAHPIDWVVPGGESGPGARPCNVAWVRSIVKQCGGGSVPVFVKQLGATPVPRTWHNGRHPVTIDHRKGADMGEWPRDLRTREFPKVTP